MPQEVSAPALMGVVFLIVAAVAWAVTIVSSRSMDAMNMSLRMGLGTIDAFIVSWTVMMLAMMLPSATPLVFEFARNAEGRRGWRAATALLGLTYIGVWLAFGLVCYSVYNLLGMPWPNQTLVGGAALALAGLYALTPLKRATEARCRELCALHGPLPFKLMRSAVIAGGRYGLSCLGCSAGLMLAMLLIGMANLVWMIVIAALVVIYKLAPAPTRAWGLALSLALVALGALYAASA